MHSFTLDGVNPYSPLIQATDGNFYGTTLSGGTSNRGTVFRLDPAGRLTTLHSFEGPPSDGSFPSAGLIQARDGNFYGTTDFGGANDNGTAFKMDLSGRLTALHSFAGSTTCYRGFFVRISGLIQAADGNFYGTTSSDAGCGGNFGTVFKMDSSGNLTTLYSFGSGEAGDPHAGLIQASDGALYGTTPGMVFRIDSLGHLTTLHSFGVAEGGPHASLLQATDGNFYGTTSAGGANDFGTVFRMDLSGNLTTLYRFTNSPSDGGSPVAGLIQARDGYLYGTTGGDGVNDFGTVFRMDLVGYLTTLHSFATQPRDGERPFAMLLQASDGNFYGTTSGIAGYGGTIFRMDSGGNLTTIIRLGYVHGATPYAGLIQARDGDFYGTTSAGGTMGLGSVFKMDASGTLTVLHSFGDSSGEGSGPSAALVQATDGNFYGTTSGGGSAGAGTVFKVDPSGNLTTLHNFTGFPSEGAYPRGALIQATDGYFYGTTVGGGQKPGSSEFCRRGCGTVFKMDSAGDLTTLHSFEDSPGDGSVPSAGVIQATDGNFYGTTPSGGSGYRGTVFRVDPSGNLTALHSFTVSDGYAPVSLIQANDGYFYGTASEGGSELAGSIFRIDASGTLTTLHSFARYAGEGRFPSAGLIQATDGNFYGTTFLGGSSQVGTVFKVDPSGNLTTLHSFAGTPTDGSGPSAALVQATDGGFYGTTDGGGAGGVPAGPVSSGTVFRFTVRLLAPRIPKPPSHLVPFR